MYWKVHDIHICILERCIIIVC